jgi:hypothetical protein
MFSGNTSQVSDGKLYVEDVFSTWLYTGTGAAQTITNGIDLAGKGGLVWIKERSAGSNFLFDTLRGVNIEINSDTTNANTTLANSLTAFNSNGFSISGALGVGQSSATYASWTFREAPKFFDVVTYTGTGANRTIAHNLGVAPGCIMVKRTDGTTDWQVYHRSFGNTQFMMLNQNQIMQTSATRWNNTTPTATGFTVGTDASVNASGGTYVAYLFAHDTTADGIIQCGSYTRGADGSAAVNLGWEPQWLLTKVSNETVNIISGDWIIIDNIRGFPSQASGNGTRILLANTTNAESNSSTFTITNTGFLTDFGTFYADVTESYIAIRRGPMKIPTLGTNVFAPVARTGTGVNATVSSGFSTDMVIEGNRTSTGAGTKFGVWSRIRFNTYLISNTTAAQASGSTAQIQSNPWDVMDGYKVGTTSTLTNASGVTFINWMFRRAPGFFDEVCYTGTNSARTINHNLGVVPELIIVKRRSNTAAWQSYSSGLANTEYLVLNSTAAKATGTTLWNSTTPTSTVFTVGTSTTVNSGGENYVAYLFASCPGVSKVGSYTGNGSSQTIDCGFAAGARFVLIKRTDSTGDWYVWDTARGIVAGNDPHLSLNTTAAEVTTDDTIDTDSSGFAVNQVAATNVNVSSATYIYLAIA